MPTTVETGYLGKTSIESGTSRLPTLSSAGEPVYTPFVENAWANELLGPDGTARFLSLGYATAPNAAMHNYADEFTVVALLRMKPQAEDFGAVVAKLGTAGWSLSEVGSGLSYYNRIDTTGGINQGVGYNLPAMKKTFDRNWHWVAFSLNKGSYRSWLDGEMVLQTTYTHGAGLASSSILSVNAYGSSQSQIACLLFFNRQLADAEVSALVCGITPPKSVPGLTGYYKFNEPTGSACTDYSGAGNHMTYNLDASKIVEEYSPDGNICRPISPAWSFDTGISLSGNSVAFNNPATSSGARVAAPLITRQNSYLVKYKLSGANGTTAVRALLYAQDGSNVAGTVRTTDGTYTETLKISSSIGSFNATIYLQAMNATSVCSISEVSVIPVSNYSAAGLSGQPYPPRRKRSLASPSDLFFRLPPAIPQAQAQGCILAGAGTGYAAPDSPATRLAGDLSICGWVKPLGYNTATVWSKASSEGRFDLDKGGAFLIFQRNGFSQSISLPYTIPPSTWAFVGVTFSVAGSLVSFYVNGLLVGTKPFSPGVPVFTTSAANIGTVASTTRPTCIRSVRVFNRVITATEVDSIFRTDSFPRTDPTMVAEFMCNELWNSTVRDTSMYANHCGVSSLSVINDSPYRIPRRKRSGKQVNMNSQQSTHTSAGFRAKLVGSRYLTVSCWVKTIGVFDSATPRFGVNTSTLVAGFIGAGNPPDGSLVSYTRSTEAEGAKSGTPVQYALPRRKWTLASIEIDYDLAVLKIWVDGVLRSTSQLSAFTAKVFSDSGNPQAIVAASNAHIVYDDFRIYNRSLTAEEHFKLFMGVVPRDPGLVLEWTFDNDTGGVTVDSSGNGFNGTTIGGPTYVSQQ